MIGKKLEIRKKAMSSLMKEEAPPLKRKPGASPEMGGGGMPAMPGAEGEEMGEGGMVTMELSPEEQAMILEMRQKQGGAQPMGDLPEAVM